MIKKKFYEKAKSLKPGMKVRWYAWDLNQYIVIEKFRRIDPNDYQRFGIPGCYNRISYIIIGDPIRVKLNRIYLEHPRDLMCVEILGR